MGFFLLSALDFDAGAAAAGEPADLVLRHGEIYTVDAARSWAESLAVRGDRIVFVGADAGAGAWIGPHTRVVDLGGRMVLPGFQDRHVHPVSGGVELLQCDLNGSADRAEVLERVRACAARLGDRPWLLGGGWDLTLFPGGVADRRDLDAILPDRPALLSSADGHSSWVNSKALALAGIAAASPDPEGGRIERDAAGEPIGTLRETAADLVEKLVPETTAEERRAGLRLAVERAHRFGIVAVTEANAGPETTAAYDSLDRAGELGLRAVISMALGPEEGPAGDPRARRPPRRASRAARPGDGGQALRRRRDRRRHRRAARALRRQARARAFPTGRRRRCARRSSRSTASASRSTSTPSATGRSATPSTPSTPRARRTAPATPVRCWRTSSSSRRATSRASASSARSPTSSRSGPTKTPTSAT